jgi:hypothetical protein
MLWIGFFRLCKPVAVAAGRISCRTRWGDQNDRFNDGMTHDTRVKKVSGTCVQFRISWFCPFLRLPYIIYIFTVISVTSVIAQ